MKIKIDATDKSRTLVYDALLAVNGKADTHTYLYHSQVKDVAAAAETALDKLGLPKKDRAGATWYQTSDGNLPSAYKYEAIGTGITLTRGALAWYLTGVQRVDIYPRQPQRKALTLTVEQDAIAVDALRRAYKVAA